MRLAFSLGCDRRLRTSVATSAIPRFGMIGAVPGVGSAVGVAAAEVDGAVEADAAAEAASLAPGLASAATWSGLSPRRLASSTPAPSAAMPPPMIATGSSHAGRR